MYKSFLIFIFVAISNLLLSQKELTLNPILCQVWNQESRFYHKFELYKDGRITDNKFNPKNEFTVSGLKKGEYLLTYQSVFEQNFEQKIKLKRRKTRVTICVDNYVPIKKRTFIDELESNDTLEFWSDRTGCEYEDYGTLQIIKKENGMEAIFIKNNNIQRKILSKNQLKLIRDLEQKIIIINEIGEDGYTNTFHYGIKLNGESEVSAKYGINAVGFDFTMKKIFK